MRLSTADLRQIDAYTATWRLFDRPGNTAAWDRLIALKLELGVCTAWGCLGERDTTLVDEHLEGRPELCRHHLLEERDELTVADEIAHAQRGSTGGTVSRCDRTTGCDG